jgi:threonylcarbamoyladenosine tRNA methylthiotransferase MtaB
MKKVAAVTFGCKVNQYETACILDQFRSAGYTIIDFKDKSDVYIINSCTVTNRTDYKSRNAVRKALEFKAADQNVKVIVTGCYAQRNVIEIRQLGPVDLVIDNDNKHKILEYLNNDPPHFTDIFSAVDFAELSTTTMLDRSRAFIKVQDGCNFFCAYCAVPFGRGNPRSRKPEKVVKQVQELVNTGFKEFVLGGINLGLYGKDRSNGYPLTQLLTDLEQTAGLEIIRLSSIEPQLFSDDLLNFLKSSQKTAPHFHIPLQSGSDTILKKMNRHYSVEEFRQLILKILEISPAAAIGLDVIAGLPGETETLFRETLDLINQLPVSYLHVFSYSKRPGTKAAAMKGQISGDIIKQRSTMLTEISAAKKNLYTEKLIKEKLLLKGIAEKKKKEVWTALSDHYIRIYSTEEGVSEKSLLKGKAGKMFKDGIMVEHNDRN